MNPTFLADEHGRPYPQGTIAQVRPLYDHTGVIVYQYGQQVILQNSKRFKGKVATTPQVFNEGRPTVVIRVPTSHAEGAAIAQRAWAEVQAGGSWHWWDNCQDFTSRAVQGKNGSPTRDLFVVLGAALGVLSLALASSRE